MIETRTKPLLLIFPFEALAHYLRCIKLATYLSSYFEVKFLHTNKYTSFLEDVGYSTFQCDTFNAGKVQEAIRKFDFSWLNEKDLEHIYLMQVETIEQLQPEVVLGDTMPTLKMAAEKTGVKYVSLMNGYISRYYANTHHLPSSHPLYKYIKMLPESILRFFIQVGEQQSYKEIHEPFKLIRERYYLLNKESYEDELEGDLNMVCDLEDLFPQSSLPYNYHVIPPLYFEGAIGHTNISNRLDATKKTLFVSMGSTGEWEDVSFLNDPAFVNYNIITAGDSANAVKGTNVIRLPFANIHEVLPYTDLVICHGGNGTIYQALCYGIPLLCKTSHFEQEWNVQALEKHQLGKWINEIAEVEAYKGIVDEWIGKKGSRQHRFIKNKISKARDNFAGSISSALKTLFQPVAQVA